MTPKARTSSQVDIRDFAVWALGVLAQRPSNAHSLRDMWNTLFPTTELDASSHDDLQYFVGMHWEASLAVFFQKGYAKADFVSQPENPVWHITPGGQDYLSSPAPLLVTSQKANASLRHTRLLGRLLSLRNTLCHESGLPPFRVFPDTLLSQLLLHQPTTLSELENVNGMGTFKIRRYGARILEALSI